MFLPQDYLLLKMHELHASVADGYERLQCIGDMDRGFLGQDPMGCCCRRCLGGGQEWFAEDLLHPFQITGDSLIEQLHGLGLLQVLQIFIQHFCTGQQQQRFDVLVPFAFQGERRRGRRILILVLVVAIIMKPILQ